MSAMIDTRALALMLTLTAAPAFALVSYALARVVPLPRPVHGARGIRRARALAGPFALVEPPLRWLAASIARLPLAALRVRCQRAIIEAGDLCGFDVNELLACSLLSSAGATLAACAAQTALAWSPLPALGALLGAGMPFIALRERRKRRQHAIARRLPTAIDLLALCMDAGLDFAGALELVAQELTRPDEPLGEELLRVRQELVTGRTRQAALAAFALRVPSPAVRDFASAVAQADQKGNPLAETLDVQAQMLRMRRSIVAEEAAARASVLLILPVVVLMIAILLLLFGPFLVRGVRLS